MKYVERDKLEVPDGLFDHKAAEINRQALVEFFGADFEKLSQSNLEIMDWVLEDNGVRDALSVLFGGRCAFCESVAQDSSGMVHRFRPKSEASPVQHTGTSHLYYLWMSDAWQNLYYICRDCSPENRSYFPVASGKRSGFPTAEEIEQYASRKDGRWPFYPLNEKLILVDPCYDRMLWRHFEYLVTGEVTGRDRRGRETVSHFSLDRPDLTAQRGEAFSEYLNGIFSYIDGGKMDSKIMSGIDAPYFGAWRILLRNLLAIALDKRASDNLEAQLGKLTQLPDRVERFQRAVESFSLSTKMQVSAEETAPLPRFAEVPSEVQIRNFKSLEDLTVRVPQRPSKKTGNATSLMILGENAAGKSSILEAIAIALMGEDRRRLLGLKANDFILNPAYMGAENTSGPDEAIIELSYDLTGSSAGTSRLILRSSQNEDSARAHAFEEQTSSLNTLPLFSYGAFRKYLSAERRFSKDKHVRSLFHPDHVISNPEKWLLRLSNDDFAMVARALRYVFSVEVEFDVLERDMKARKVYVVASLDGQASGITQRTPLDIVSSGFRSVLAMLCDIMQGLMDKRINPAFESLPTAEGLVLIDEVEAHLHPRWKMSIMDGLRQALPQVTFIATSHDPLCLRGMKRDEVIVLERVSGELSNLDLQVFTQSIVDLPDNEHWTIEQLLTADFFQLRSTASQSEKRMAEIERKLARGERDADVEDFLKNISATLPIGDTEIHRLVQDAIANYIINKREATATKRKALREETKAHIVRALQAAR